ncbi:sensor histidine kinase [Puia dinghuensis]|uniref:Signal transduction histidine kinase internal region domain-containing protein n=1 Tax=Puia dinghuensis TaxID=1792502 RepID=A0A8J2UCP1_9BACT|nr:histidine kinase [Puia dinghuensis]GGA98199.1 hypothetical protein GCM10011511_21900 [Puia dinghuensis]
MSQVDCLLHYQQKYRPASHVVFWLGVLLLAVSNSKYHDGQEFTWRWGFIGNGIFLFPQMLAAYFLTYAIIPAFFYRRKYVWASIGFVLGSYCICLLARFLIVRVAEPLAGVAPKAFETNREIVTNISKLLYVYFFSIFSLPVVFLFVKLLLQQLRTQQRTLVLEKEKAETELKLLKSQLNPHFLFNTLNNIYALSLLNSPATSSAIGKLSEILDHILYRCEGDLAPLSEEVELLNNYLALEQLRYDQRLQLRFNSRVNGDVAIPPLLLLSLAENAFKHGASQDAGEPSIEIELEADEAGMRYCVTNSSAAPPVQEGYGKIGLANLRKQLDILYPGKHVFTTGYDAGRFRALVVLDLKKESHEYPVSAGR